MFFSPLEEKVRTYEVTSVTSDISDATVHSLFFSMAGGLRYSFLTLRGNSKPAQPGDEENALPVSKS